MSNVQQYNPGTLPDIFRDMVPQGGVGVNDDLTQGVGMGFAHLSIKGKVFHIHDGDDVELQTNEMNMPAQYMDLVLIKAARNMSKVYYIKNFTEGSEDKPDCYSNDGIVPDPASPAKQAPACAGCQWNQWGSRTSADFDSKGKACQDARRMAVSTIQDIDLPMLLRVPPVTLKELAGYGNMLAKRGVPYQAVVSRVYFDSSVAYPKLMFQAVRFLTNEEAVKVKELMDDELVNQICGFVAIPQQAQSAQAQQQTIAGQPPQAFAQQAQAAKEAFEQFEQFEQVATPAPAPAPQSYQPEGGMFGQQAPAPAPAPVPTPAPAPAPAATGGRRKRTPAAQQAAASAPSNVVPMQSQPATSPLPNGAAHEGVNVVTGELAGGIDQMLSGLPDVPNI